MRPQVADFRWPPGVEEKVASKHGLSREEVEECFFDPYARVRKGKGVLHLFSRTEAGAYVFVVFTFRQRQATIITARHMTTSERRLFRRK